MSASGAATTHICLTLPLLSATICRVNVSGVAVQQWVSMVWDLLPPEFLETPKTHMHGGPPVVHISAAASGTGRPYYLGVMHYWDVSAAREPGAA
jgi:hypothetical protein